MKYKKYELGPYNLHLIKTDKFKKIRMEILFKRKLVKEELPYRHFLYEIIGVTSKNYPTIKSVKIAQEDLYALYYRNFDFIHGHYHIINFIVEFLNEKYTEKGMNERSIEFLFELILNPNIKNGEFDSSIFLNAKERLMDNIKSIKENSGRYSQIRLFQEMDKNAPFSFSLDEYLKQLEKITPKSLYDYYQTFIKKDFIDIFVVGDVDYSSLKKIIMEKFKINTLKKPTGLHRVEHSKFRKKTKKVVEPSKFNQSKLLLGIKLGKLTDFEMHYVAPVYTHILGGGSDSKLFKTVREKYSYCYSIYSGYYPINKMMIISAGIDKKNYNHVIKLIKKEMKNMVDGNFNVEDIQKYISNYISMYEELFDQNTSIIDYYFNVEYNNPDHVEKRIEKVKKVTKKDVISFAKKVNIDTIFLLEGEADGEK